MRERVDVDDVALVDLQTLLRVLSLEEDGCCGHTRNLLVYVKEDFVNNADDEVPYENEEFDPATLRAVSATDLVEHRFHL